MAGVDKCAKEQQLIITPETIVNTFECIGRTSKSSDEALKRVVEFDNYLGQTLGLTELQASLFGAQISDYQPTANAPAVKIHKDLSLKMKEVMEKKITKNTPVNDTTPTGIDGLDKLRAWSTGANIMIGAAETYKEWPRNEVGTTIQLVEVDPWPRNKVGTEIQEHVVHKPWGRNEVGSVETAGEVNDYLVQPTLGDMKTLKKITGCKRKEFSFAEFVEKIGKLPEPKQQELKKFFHLMPAAKVKAILERGVSNDIHLFGIKADSKYVDKYYAKLEQQDIRVLFDILGRNTFEEHEKTIQGY